MSNASDSLDPPVLTPSPSESVKPKPVVAGLRLVWDLTLVSVWVLLTDVLLYRIGTFVTWAAMLVIAVLFLGLLKRFGGHRWGGLFSATLLIGLAVKLVWCGSWLQVGCGVFLVFCYVMALTGLPPFLPEAISFFGHVCAGGGRRLSRFRLRQMDEVSELVGPGMSAQVLLPLLVVGVFSSLFILANPDIANSVGTAMGRVARNLGNWILHFDFGEGLFWLASGWLLLGLLYPAGRWLLPERVPAEYAQSAKPAPLYTAFRNSLLSVIVLFAIYLVFEFNTLWLRNFPQDFYYAGYAHQGAFWLTVALALSTAVLCLVFRGNTLSDPRRSRLQGLAMLWSVQNLLLSLAVYNRLFIYIDYNGLTRMRVIGLLGITSVLIGFVLVVVKILRHKDAIWLLHRQLLVPVLALLVYAMLPIDWIVQRYNVRQTLLGNSAAVVQVIAQPSTAEGMLPVLDLVDSADPRVRDGVRAMLAVWHHELNSASKSPGVSADGNRAWRSALGHSTPWSQLPFGFSHAGRDSTRGWQNFQWSETLLRTRLAEQAEKWQPYADSVSLRRQALDDFFAYAYQWY